MRSVSAHALAGFVEISPKALNVFECVRPSTGWTGVRLGAPSLQRQLAEVAVIDTDEFSDFAGCKPAEVLAGFWREQLHAVGMKLRGEFPRVGRDRIVDRWERGRRDWRPACWSFRATAFSRSYEFRMQDMRK